MHLCIGPIKISQAMDRVAQGPAGTRQIPERGGSAPGARAPRGGRGPKALSLAKFGLDAAEKKPQKEPSPRFFGGVEPSRLVCSPARNSEPSGRESREARGRNHLTLPISTCPLLRMRLSGEA